MGLVVGWSPLLVSPASGQVPPGQGDLRCGYRLASDPGPVPSFKCSSTVGEGDSLRTGHAPTHKDLSFGMCSNSIWIRSWEVLPLV